MWRRNISFWTEMDHFKAFSMILNPVVQMFWTMAHISFTLMPYKDLLECQTLSFPVHAMSRYARNITRICRPTTCVNIISSSIMNVHSRIHSFLPMDLQLIPSCLLSMSPSTQACFQNWWFFANSVLSLDFRGLRVWFS